MGFSSLLPTWFVICSYNNNTCTLYIVHVYVINNIQYMLQLLGYLSLRDGAGILQHFHDNRTQFFDPGPQSYTSNLSQFPNSSHYVNCYIRIHTRLL